MKSAPEASQDAERRWWSTVPFLEIDHPRAPHPFAIDGAHQTSENPKHPLRKEVGEKKQKFDEGKQQLNSLFCPWEQKVRCLKTPEQEGKLNEEHSAGTHDDCSYTASWGIPVGYVALGRGQDVGGIRV